MNGMERMKVHKFFRAQSPDGVDEEFEELKGEHMMEVQVLKESRKGCTKCKMNALRRKYTSRIKEIIGRE